MGCESEKFVSIDFFKGIFNNIGIMMGVERYFECEYNELLG